MPIGPDYVDGSLDDMVNGWPATGAVYAWWTADPLLQADPSTVEVDLSVGGLTNPDFAPTDYSDSSGGVKSAAAAISVGTSTAALDDVGTYWGIKDSGGSIVYSDDLTDDAILEVDESGDAVSFTPPNLTFGNS